MAPDPLVLVIHRGGRTTGRLNSWDQDGCTVDGHRIPGPVIVIVNVHPITSRLERLNARPPAPPAQARPVLYRYTITA